MSFRDTLMNGAAQMLAGPQITRSPEDQGGGSFGDMSFLDDPAIFDAPEPEPEPVEEDDFEDDETGESGDPPAGQQQQQGQGQDLTPEQLKQRVADLDKALKRERGLRRQAQGGAFGGQGQQQQQRQAPQQGQGEQQQQGHGRQGVDDFVDPDKDPIAAVTQMQRLIKDFQAAERTRNEGQQQASEQAARYSRIDNAFREDEVSFRRENPDFDQAAAHWLQARARELATFGMDRNQIEEGLRMEMRRLTASAIPRGESPAELLYSLAKSRGYQKADGQQQQQQGDGKGGKATGTNAALDRIRQGAQAQSPMARNGSGGKRQIDAATVSKIDIHSKKGGEAFDKAWEAFEAGEKSRERARGRR